MQDDEKINASIQAVNKGNVKFLFNTHYHGDHAGGNANFAKMGATIFAHENVRARLTADSTKLKYAKIAQPQPAEAIACRPGQQGKASGRAPNGSRKAVYPAWIEALCSPCLSSHAHSHLPDEGLGEEADSLAGLPRPSATHPRPGASGVACQSDSWLGQVTAGGLLSWAGTLPHPRFIRQIGQALQ